MGRKPTTDITNLIRQFRTFWRCVQCEAFSPNPGPTPARLAGWTLGSFYFISSQAVLTLTPNGKK
jgi:hypothetical protein